MVFHIIHSALWIFCRYPKCMDANNKISYLADDSLLLDEVELVLLSKKDRLYKSILRVLAYEAQGFRIGLLSILAFTVLSFFNKFIPSLVGSAPYVQMMVLSIVGSSLICADRLIFGNARKLSREALLEAYSGDYESSKSLYRQAIRGFIPPPKDIYLLALGEIYSIGGNIALGDRYIAEGMNYGASRRISIFYALRSRLFSGKISEADLKYLQDESATVYHTCSAGQIHYCTKGRASLLLSTSPQTSGDSADMGTAGGRHAGSG